MIRRSNPSGPNATSWSLITQHDHALLAGRLARQLGNPLFQAPADLDRFVRAVSLHDCGWPLHDDAPTLNSAGMPIDVFESTPQIALKVWSASVERAIPEGDDIALLVSLHVLALSANASSATAQKLEEFDMNHAAIRFEINKFQHRQIELQEGFRKRLGLRLDLPLRHGLAEESKEPAEQELAFRFRLLQAMDQLSLAACCTQPPFSTIKPVLARPAGRSLAMRVQRPDNRAVYVSPWPFGVEKIVDEIPYRAVKPGPYPDTGAFAAAYAAAPMQLLRLPSFRVDDSRPMIARSVWLATMLPMNRTRFVFLLAPLALLAIGCAAEERTYQVGVRNDAGKPITIWLCKDGGPYEEGWKSPEDIAIESPKAGTPLTGGIVPPGEVASMKPIKGQFDSGTNAVLRVYSGARKFNELLSMGPDSPLRLDVKLDRGRNTFSVVERSGKIAVDRISDLPMSDK